MSKELSPYQKRTIDAVVNKPGNVMASAGPGAGKSFLIKYINNMLKFRNPSAEILILQFNTHIADEMRLANTNPRTTIMTGNAAGNALIKANLSGKVTFDNDKYYFLVSNRVCQMYGVSKPQAFKANQRKEGWRLIKESKRLLEHCVKSIIDPDDDDKIQWLIDTYQLDVTDRALSLMIVKHCRDEGYEMAKRGIIDYDDQISFPIREGMKGKEYDYVFVDEVQDYSPAQMNIAMAFIGKNTKVAIVGDPNQSIMMFTGAMSNAMDQFAELIQATNYPLPVCYRCPKSSLDLARILVPSVQDGPNPPPGDVRFVNVDELIQEAEAGDGIVCRVTAPLVGICIAFIAKGKKAFVKGKEIGKELITVIESIVKTDGEYGFHEGIGRWKDNKMRQLENSASNTAEITKGKVEDIHDCLMALFGEHCINKGNTVDSLKSYITNMFADMDERNFVCLCTAHRSKGKEYKRMYVIMDKMPVVFDRQTPEMYRQEANLFYVALTRSMGDLVFVYRKRGELDTYERIVDHIKAVANKSGIARDPKNQPVQYDETDEAEILDLCPDPEPEPTTKRITLGGHQEDKRGAGHEYEGVTPFIDSDNGVCSPEEAIGDFLDSLFVSSADEAKKQQEMFEKFFK